MNLTNRIAITRRFLEERNLSATDEQIIEFLTQTKTMSDLISWFDKTLNSEHFADKREFDFFECMGDFLS